MGAPWAAPWAGRRRRPGQFATIAGVVAMLTLSAPGVGVPSGGHHPDSPGGGGLPISPTDVKRTALAAAGSEAWQAYRTPPAFPGLFYPSLASDPLDGEVVMFGGCTGVACTTGTNGTWTYSNGVWTELEPSLSPSPRTEAQMAWDPVDQYVLLFGGLGCRNPPGCTINGPLNDTWGFVGGQWFPINATGGVPRTDHGALAFDPSTGQMIEFGNYGCFTGCTGWAYQHAAWTPINQSYAPAFRYGDGMAEDPSDSGVLVYGGVSSSGNYLGDTWLYSSGRWHQENGSGPRLRSDPGMGSDPALGEALLFGGDYVTLSNFPGLTYGDTWAFRSGSWRNLTSGGPAPGARFESAAAEDPVSGVFVLAGGCGGGGCPYADTWGYGQLDSIRYTGIHASCSAMVLDGARVDSGGTTTLENGSYSVMVQGCGSLVIAALTTTGGVELVTNGTPGGSANGTLNLSGSGTLVANFTGAHSLPPNGTIGSGGTSSAGLQWTPITVLGLAGIGVAVAAVVVIFLRRGRPPPRRDAPSPDEGTTVRDERTSTVGSPDPGSPDP